ncbi:monooxygenase-like protein [Hypoxylon sp. FL1150]|nr:monooxygenase-like protein [Hypoxylon sp. FL1150]
MEKTEVVIVGAGPAGLALALSLAKFNIHSVILEKDLEITKDPRGVYLTHDAVRILWTLGLGDSLKEIGHEPLTVNFHTTSFVNSPFHILHLNGDKYWQTIPNAMLHIQPKLESAMREKVMAAPCCDLRRGCTVMDREQCGENIIVQYEDGKGNSQKIQGSFLIGADGKRGVVRKHFLEASAGIKQVDSAYRYDGTWVAANLKLKLPTPDTHPAFPLWNLGFTPEAVYDLFWPKGWHFCSPPGKPTAAGRFGPYEARMWRHEFAQNNWDDSMDAEELLWEHLKPMITHSKDKLNRPFPGGEVTYPLDCIHILRCRPYRFTHKVVNKWFDDRIILIGDAAHVFPPFGGQGIASGLRDAHQLAWRIALFQRMSEGSGTFRDSILKAWARERHEGVRGAATLTSLNGRACNEGDSFLSWLMRNLIWLVNHTHFLPKISDPIVSFETRGYKQVEDGFFSKKHGGGGRLAQIYVHSKNQTPILSDELIKSVDTVMTLLIVARGSGADLGAEMLAKLSADLDAEAQAALRTVKLERSVLSEDSIRILSADSDTDTDLRVYSPTPSRRLAEMGITVKKGYSTQNYMARFGPTAKFVIVRPDLYIFSLASNARELAECLDILRVMLRVRLG